MSIQEYRHSEQVLYQMDPQTAGSFNSIRDRMHQICRQHMNQLVRVETLDGDVFEGIVAGCDKGVLFLRQQSNYGSTQRFMPFNSSAAILTLVLFELLVITLLI